MTYFSLHVILNEVKNPTEELTVHMLFTLVVGYFAALNMTCFFVFASMPSEQTCLQGFANDGIHETIGVFLKNAKNRQVFVRR